MPSSSWQVAPLRSTGRLVTLPTPESISTATCTYQPWALAGTTKSIWSSAVKPERPAYVTVACWPPTHTVTGQVAPLPHKLVGVGALVASVETLGAGPKPVPQIVT